MLKLALRLRAKTYFLQGRIKDPHEELLGIGILPDQLERVE